MWVVDLLASSDYLMLTILADGPVLCKCSLTVLPRILMVFSQAHYSFMLRERDPWGNRTPTQWSENPSAETNTALWAKTGEGGSHIQREGRLSIPSPARLTLHEAVGAVKCFLDCPPCLLSVNSVRPLLDRLDTLWSHAQILSSPFGENICLVPRSWVLCFHITSFKRAGTEN